MEQSSSEKQLRIRKQFDSFCKTLLKNEMIDYERARSYQQKHEVSFSELTQEELPIFEKRKNMNITVYPGANEGNNPSAISLLP